MSCEYCKGEVSCLPIESIIKYVKQKEDYILVGLKHSSDKDDFQPSMRFESCVDDKVCRTTLEINYCPMCGRKLK